VEQGFPARRIDYGLIAAVVVLAAGTVGFHDILGEGWVGAFYRAVVTTSLAGIDSVPDTAGGQVLSVVLILCGVTIFAFVGAAVVEAIARGVFSGAERRRRKMVERLRGHTIICGYGRVGQRIAEEFQRSGAEFVVVDNDPEEVETARQTGAPAIEGDAIDVVTSDEGPDLRFEQIEVTPGCPAAGKSIRALEDPFAPAGAGVS
jgi:voltage-gated potassium channel